MRLAILACSICVLFSGCAAIEDYHYCWVHHRRAASAWKSLGDRRSTSVDYADGWKEGYYQVSTGGCADPPPVPPNKYWATKYQSVSGREAINDWFAGYQDGATEAQAEGNEHWHPIPTGPTIPSPDDPHIVVEPAGEYIDPLHYDGRFLEPGPVVPNPDLHEGHEPYGEPVQPMAEPHPAPVPAAPVPAPPMRVEPMPPPVSAPTPAPPPAPVPAPSPAPAPTPAAPMPENATPPVQESTNPQADAAPGYQPGDSHPIRWYQFEDHAEPRRNTGEEVQVPTYELPPVHMDVTAVEPQSRFAQPNAAINTSLATQAVTAVPQHIAMPARPVMPPAIQQELPNHSVSQPMQMPAPAPQQIAELPQQSVQSFVQPEEVAKLQPTVTQQPVVMQQPMVTEHPSASARSAKEALEVRSHQPRSTQASALAATTPEIPEVHVDLGDDVSSLAVERSRAKSTQVAVSRTEPNAQQDRGAPAPVVDSPRVRAIKTSLAERREVQTSQAAAEPTVDAETPAPRADRLTRESVARQRAGRLRPSLFSAPKEPVTTDVPKMAQSRAANVKRSATKPVSAVASHPVTSAAGNHSKADLKPAATRVALTPADALFPPVVIADE